MMDQATALKTVIGMQEKGELDGIGPNAMVVRLMAARLITTRVPRDVRKEMMDAVKQGKLGHIKKDGLRPEAFHHPNARGYALDLRDRAFRESVEAIKKTLAADGTKARMRFTGADDSGEWADVVVVNADAIAETVAQAA